MGKSFKLVFLNCLIFIIGVTLVQAADFQFKSGSKPDGFGDIKWGTPVSSTSDMEHVETRVLFDQTYIIKWGAPVSPIPETKLEVYRRSSDIMKMGNVDLSAINYIFLEGRLHSIEISVSGKENFMLFRKELIERYGGDNQSRPLVEMYFWLGDGPNDPIGILSYDDGILAYGDSKKEKGVFCLDTGEFHTRFKTVPVE